MAKSALLLDAVKEAEGWTTDDQDYQQILNDEAANANMSQEDFPVSYTHLMRKS